MRVLALDTALGATSVALYDSESNRILAEESERMERGHSEALMPMVERVMKAAGIAFRDIDRFAVVTGPGSFTGLRIGIAAARAFALVHKRPAVGVSTLAAFAVPYLFGEGAKPVAAAIDARHGMVFFQAMVAGGRTIAGPGLFSLADAARRIGDGAVVYAGNAAAKLAEARRDALISSTTSSGTIVEKPAPDIVFVAKLGVVADPASAPARPLYLREANVTVQDRNRLQRA